MTKTLTQDVFANAPEWVRSAAIDGDGDLWFFGCKAGHIIPDVSSGWFQTKIRCIYAVYSRYYDTADWQNSAIDRE